MKKICIVTGGTGGHIYPALALAEVWKEQEPDLSLVFIGNDNRMEAQLIPAAGYRFLSLHTCGFTGTIFDKAKAAFQMMKARRQAKAYLKKEKPDLVIGFGGYVSAPVYLAAQALHIPVVMHEQNSIVGKANRIAQNKADLIVTCYEKATQDFPEGKAMLLGNPRATLASRCQKDDGYFRSLGLKDGLKTILIVMGSLGSSSVNELMKEALKQIDPGLQILYVCGKDNDEDLNLFDGMDNIHVVPYVDTMHLYRHLDGMVCRAGATTIAELTALGIPSILIPSPYVAANHQYYNAKMLADQNAAMMIEEKDLNAQTLREGMNQAFLNEENRKKLSENALRLGKPQAAQNIIEQANGLISRNARKQVKQ